MSGAQTRLINFPSVAHDWVRFAIPSPIVDRKRESVVQPVCANCEIRYFIRSANYTPDGGSRSEADYHSVQLSLITSADRTMRIRVILRDGRR